MKTNPTRKEIKTIETLTNLTTKKLEIYSVKMQDGNEKFSLNTELNKLERKVLLTLPNPKYSKILKKYPHSKEVHMNDTDEKEQLAVHIILEASDFAKIKMEKSPRVQKIGEPFAEVTKMGWVMMSPGREKYIRKPQLVIMKNCVVLISWVYKKPITIMMNLCLINSKNN